jgi:hypothetical protein
VDGTQVVNYAEWASETAYRQSFDRNPDKAAMRDAIRKLPGVIDGPKMTGIVPDLRIAVDSPVPAESNRTTADSLRRATMQLGSRLRLERPAEMPTPDELNTLVALSNHGAAPLEKLAEWNQMPLEAVREALDTLIPAELIEGPSGDQQLYHITAKGQLVLDEGRRVRNEWLLHAAQLACLSSAVAKCEPKVRSLGTYGVAGPGSRYVRLRLDGGAVAERLPSSTSCAR